MKKILLIICFLCANFSVAQQIKISPNGYYTKGNKIYNEYHQIVHFKGVNRPSLEWMPKGKYIVKDDFKKIAETGANIVRIPLNQHFWLVDSVNYRERIDTVISWCMNLGLNVILDLHWSQKNNPNLSAEQQEHADEISLEFWYKVATKYKSNGRIFFELYNEPHSISWNEIINGGINDNNTPNDSTDDWRMAGYQQLYDTVRAAGADNLVIIGGNDWSFDLSYYNTNPINGYNIVYASHCYPYSTKLSNNWYKWTLLAKKYPVILTEFGPKQSTDTSYVQELIDTVNQLGVHWTAWAWFNFKQNNMWNNFDPTKNTYDTSIYGAWVLNQLQDNNTSNLILSHQYTCKISPYLLTNNNLIFNNNYFRKLTFILLNGKQTYCLFTSNNILKLNEIKELVSGQWLLRIQEGKNVYTGKFIIK